MFDYKKLGNLTYTIIKDSQKIKPFLLKWILKEWKVDNKEHPNQIWTQEWIKALPQMSFQLQEINLERIKLRKDLMKHQTLTYSFIDELKDRVKERKESMLRGISIEPLLINKKGYELMDGYTRYLVLKELKEKQTYAYIGAISS